MSTHVISIYAKFHSNLSTKYGDITSRKISVNGRTDGRRTTRKHNAFRLLLVGRGITSMNELNEALTEFHRPLTTVRSWLMRSLCSADVSLLKYIDRPLLFNTRTCCLLSLRLSSRSCITTKFYFWL